MLAYDDDIILFTVPPDMFSDIKKINGTPMAPVHDDGDEYDLGTWSDWLLPSCTSSGYRSTFASQSPLHLPVTIKGAKIGRVGNVVDLAVQSSPELVVWATSANGISCTWTITGAPGLIKPIQRMVDIEGAVHIMRDQDGDWIMPNSWPLKTR